MERKVKTALNNALAVTADQTYSSVVTGSIDVVLTLMEIHNLSPSEVSQYIRNWRLAQDIAKTRETENE